jgi:hypothetical protein
MASFIFPTEYIAVAYVLGAAAMSVGVWLVGSAGWGRATGSSTRCSFGHCQINAHRVAAASDASHLPPSLSVKGSTRAHQPNKVCALKVNTTRRGGESRLIPAC